MFSSRTLVAFVDGLVNFVMRRSWFERFFMALIIFLIGVWIGAPWLPGKLLGTVATPGTKTVRQTITVRPLGIEVLSNQIMGTGVKGSYPYMRRIRVPENVGELPGFPKTTIGAVYGSLYLMVDTGRIRHSVRFGSPGDYVEVYVGDRLDSVYHPELEWTEERNVPVQPKDNR